MNASEALALVLQDRPIAFRPDLARIAGSATAGLFLSQLLYWTPRGRTIGEVVKRAADWERETTLSTEEQATARRRLRDRGLITERRVGAQGTLAFRPQVEAIALALQSLYEAEADETEEDRFRESPSRDSGKARVAIPGKPESRFRESRKLSITESTTESTTKKARSEADKAPPYVSIPLDLSIHQPEGVGNATGASESDLPSGGSLGLNRPVSGASERAFLADEGGPKRTRVHHEDRVAGIDAFQASYGARFPGRKIVWSRGPAIHALNRLLSQNSLAEILERLKEYDRRAAAGDRFWAESTEPLPETIERFWNKLSPRAAKATWEEVLRGGSDL